MKKLIQLALSICLLGLAAFPSQAAFTSLHIFGDGVSTTTNYGPSSAYYYGYRNSNGRVWVEVLAQRLGLGANSINNPNWSNSSNNWSYYGQYSQNLMQSIRSFPKPSDSNPLYVIWVDDADFVADIGAFSTATNAKDWNIAITNSVNNHWNIITNLYYAKGAHTLIMPNAVDITEIPQFDGIANNNPSDRTFIRNEVIYFNSLFTTMLNQARALGITIYEPDFFSLLDNVLTNAPAYGLTNALSYNVSIDALSDLQNPVMNGAGDNFIFWDPTDPTAKFHEIMADTTMQMIAPVSLNDMVLLSPSTASIYTNRLDIVNTPVGLNGFVDGTTNLYQKGWAWATVTNITSTSTVQSVFVYGTPLFTDLPGGNGNINPGGPSDSNTPTPTNAPPSYWQAYRLRFPMAWNWP